ncbi:unnamed protein product [Hymenolepis diminuta]|uniref:FAR1 domain-containing protein n=1 Tax=Hymenolepis diminuta TaxID=6216 RepID=A0A564YL79_HYMDI|nr:unnamed protein product [Hymenolepis diminuta]
MTAIAEFEQKIASQRFSSFQQLQENLKDFSDTYGYKFVNSKFSYFPENTINRQLFVYKYLDLKCAYAKKRGCVARCNVRCRNNHLYVRDWSMEHNHPPDPPDTSTLVDCTESFRHIFIVRLFDSLQDLEARIHELERVTGTRFTKYSSRMLPETSEHRERLVYERVNYACIHAGKTKTRCSAYVGVRSQKIGCQARIRACIAGDKLKVMLFSMKHNHIVSNDYQGHMSFPSSNENFAGTSGLEDADVDYELHLPNLDSASETLFRGDDLPSIPIVFKKTRSSQQQSNKPIRRVKCKRSPSYDGYFYGDQREGDVYHNYDDGYFYDSLTVHRRPKRSRTSAFVNQAGYDGIYCNSDDRENDAEVEGEPVEVAESVGDELECAYSSEGENHVKPEENDISTYLHHSGS